MLSIHSENADQDQMFPVLSVRLGRLAGATTTIFAACIATMLLLERIGVNGDIIAYIFILFELVLFTLVGFGAKTLNVAEFFVAGRRLPAVWAGMATAAALMASFTFFTTTGLYGIGFRSAAFLGAGLIAGMGLSVIVLASALNSSRCRTVPEFLGTRFASPALRLFSAIVLVIVLVALLAAILTTTAEYAGRFLLLGRSYLITVLIALAVLPGLFGGMRAAARVLIVQYIVLAAGLLVPLAWLAWHFDGTIIPQLSYGSVILPGLETMPADQVSDIAWLSDFGIFAGAALGVAALPIVANFGFSASSRQDSRTAFAWAMAFSAILILSAPAIAFFAAAAVEAAIGASLGGQLPAWAANWASSNDLTLCQGASRVVDGNCDSNFGQGGAQLLLSGRAMVLAAPQIAGLPVAMSVAVLAAAFAMALSSLTMLAQSMAAIVSVDIYAPLLRRRPTPNNLIFVAHLAVLAMAALVVTAILWLPVPFGELPFVALALCGATILPAASFATWWPNGKPIGVIAGMAAGIVAGALHLQWQGHWQALWHQSTGRLASDPSILVAGVSGAAACMIVAVAVSLLSARLDKKSA